MQEDGGIRLTDVIAPSFYKIHWDIADGKYRYYNLYGGRGSCKSSFISVEFVLYIIAHKKVDGVIFRKVGNTLRESVYAQIGWAIDILGLTDKFKAFVSPMKYVYIPTGQEIVFHGLDDPRKLKSIKAKSGHFGVVWFEELDEFEEVQVRNVQQSVMRGGDDCLVFKSFNPPISIHNWANQMVQMPDRTGKTLNHKSNYLSVPVEWLGTAFIEEAEHLKETDEKAYRHEYLGEAVGIGTTIFDKLEIRSISDEEIRNFEYIYQGQDWGWYPDPKAFLRISYNHQKEKIYAIDEMGGCKIRNKNMAKMISDKGYDDYSIYCGADEQESIVDFQDLGLPARSVDNRPGSVKYEMEWLQCRTLVIDPARTPKFYKEVIEYEHEVDKSGEVIPEYPDYNNHFIDACRYAVSSMALRRGEHA